jgi:hypothetical protein
MHSSSATLQAHFRQALHRRGKINIFTAAKNGCNTKTLKTFSPAAKLSTVRNRAARIRRLQHHAKTLSC